MPLLVYIVWLLYCSL